MKDYVAAFQNKISEINADSKNINIINAGIMNHGKSSLFNSLLDNEAFAAQDVRTTIINQQVQWMENVYLIDTPGLAAEESDDTAAYEAYRRANMIIFVHNVKVGELHDKELDAINKIRALFNDDKFFCEHFCLALTFKDSDSEGSILSIRTKTLNDIKSHCNISGFQTFIVSNSRYQKGTAENKRALIRHSGIIELREYLKQHFDTWNDENKYFRTIRITNEKNSIINALNIERANIQQSIDTKTEQIKQRQQNFLYKLEDAINKYRDDNSRVNSERTQLQRLKDQLSSISR